MTSLQNILFLDIETVSQYSTYEELPENWKDLWGKKADILLRNKEEQRPETIYERASIYAEFGKVVCISCGIITGLGPNKKMVIKSFAGDDEKELLGSFCDMLTKWAGDHPKYLCAHNGKEFDFPYLCRRMIILDICIPSLLSISGKKPWEVGHIDTMEMWKFGDYKSYTSLNLLATVLGVPTPKDDIDGSMVGHVYWKSNDLQRIVTYCQKDVITLIQIYLRMTREPMILPENIEIKN